MCHSTVYDTAGEAKRVRLTDLTGISMKACFQLLGACLLCTVARAEVRVWVENRAGEACVRYRCTAGEVVRAFALDVVVDRGSIHGISEFFTGPCTAEARGYGIFPASFRQFATVQSGDVVTWDNDNYTPLANRADAPAQTQPGLGSAGVTIELAALWNLTDPVSQPEPEGKLCVLRLSEPARVSIGANVARGGVVSTNPGEVLGVNFSGTFVGASGPRVTGVNLNADTIRITFEGGELAKAAELGGPWEPTGNTSGQYSESIAGSNAKFYRVQAP